jgi:single-strand DNA-binding protein
MLIGNVGKNPEIKYTPSGIPVASLRLATSETWRDKDGKLQEHTDWHTVIAWRGLAEVIHKLVTKGSRIYVEGKIQTRTFDDKMGTRKHVVEILAENMLILEHKKLKDDTIDQVDYNISSIDNITSEDFLPEFDSHIDDNLSQEDQNFNY